MKTHGSRFYFGPFCLDVAERLLFRDNQHVPLTIKAFETLLILVRNNGHIVEKNRLLEEVWPGTYVQEATIAQNVFTLRRILGKSPEGHEYIDTVPRRGYRFTADVKERFVENPNFAAKEGFRTNDFARVETITLELPAKALTTLPFEDEVEQNGSPDRFTKTLMTSIKASTQVIETVKARIVVVGYGPVGKRVTDAIQAQEDMQVCGVVDVASPDGMAMVTEKGFSLYAPSSEAMDHMRRRGLPVEGCFIDALDVADLVVDTSPEPISARNSGMYLRARKPFIVNGDDGLYTNGLFLSALVNYRRGLGVGRARIGSCDTTSLCRILVALRTVGQIQDAFATIITCGPDPSMSSAGSINAIGPLSGVADHYALDVSAAMPDMNITAFAVRVPAMLGPVHVVKVTYAHPVSLDNLKKALRTTPRIILVGAKSGILTDAHVHELFRDLNRPRGDFWEVAVWEDSIDIKGTTAVLTYCAHMEAVSVPENIDAIRAMLELQKEPSASISMTDKALGCFQVQADYEAV